MIWKPDFSVVMRVGRMAEPPTDRELMQGIKRRNVDDLRLLHERYGRLAFAVAYRTLGESGAAEEVVQDAFLAVWNKSASFDEADGANVRAWLLAIVRNRAIDDLRRRQHRPNASVVIEDVAYLLHAPDAWGEVEANEIGRQVRAALSALPVAQQEVISLAYFDGLSQSEIAERLGIPIGTVKGRFRMGFQKLSVMLTVLADRESTIKARQT
jgi:RNA polymerase sigma-70 factor (ECF subfamily)